MKCHSCNFRVIGYGCTLTNQRVTDHHTCKEWEAYNTHTKHDADTMAQYFKAGFILDLEAREA